METTVVKRALVSAGYRNVSVRRGRGTACSWLKIRAMVNHQLGSHDVWYSAYCDIIRIAQSVTGRSGEYDGRINVDVDSTLNEEAIR